ncbi:MAG: 3-dehydroquinate dehydratase [Ramlibacter sp.]|nr:3-dehydroquinate dehydratase [Ramlibacter sp.]
MQPRAIELKGLPAAGRRFPAICAPLVGRTRERLLAEVAVVAAKQPDIIEWRVDFFEGIAHTAEVIELVAQIKHAAGAIPLLFTRRSAREGGERIPLSEGQVISLYRAVCQTGHVDIVDFEMSNHPTDVLEVREISQAREIKLILSFHDFDGTPPLDVLKARFAQAERMDADIAKVAAMPQSMDDVLTLFTATLQSSRELAIPVISMSMGRFGAVSRLCGWAFGSAMTFAVGESSSAPGQMPIEDVDAGLALLQKAFRRQDL